MQDSPVCCRAHEQGLRSCLVPVNKRADGPSPVLTFAFIVPAFTQQTVRDVASDMEGACSCEVGDTPTGGCQLSVASCLFNDVFAAEGVPHLVRFCMIKVQRD